MHKISDSWPILESPYPPKKLDKINIQASQIHSSVWKIKFQSNITQSPTILEQNLKSASWGLVC